MVLMEAVRAGAVVTFLTAKAKTIAALADLLSRQCRMPVLDESGLNGYYDFTLEFAPQRPGAMPPLEANDARS